MFAIKNGSRRHESDLEEKINEMLLSDEVSCKTCQELLGLDQKQVRLLMKAELMPES